MPDDLLKTPETAYVYMDDKLYRAEQDLADRYRSFVAEILRLSLGGLAVFSFVYKQDTPKTIATLAAKDIWSLFAVAMFALSVVFALVFLYYSSEGLRWYIAGLRYKQAIKEQVMPGKECAVTEYLCERDRSIIRCRWSKVLAAITLGLGGICMALAIIPLK